MKIIGLTGGVASGKNFIAEIFAKHGASIFDADKENHNLLELDKSTLEEVRKIFPEAIIENKIDRKILGKIVFADSKKLKTLEKIIHPRIQKKYEEFLNANKNAKIIVLNIPLLLETKNYKCDKIIAIIASENIRKERFVARATRFGNHSKNELEKRFDEIKSKQIDDFNRRNQADFVIINDGLASDVEVQIENILKKL